jgi:hypothetical protein
VVQQGLQSHGVGVVSGSHHRLEDIYCVNLQRIHVAYL